MIAEEALLAELGDRHLGLVGRAGLVQESARVALFLLGYLVGPFVRVVGARRLVLAVGRPVDADVPPAGSALAFDHVRHGGPPRLQAAIVLDEMLEPRTDIRLQPTPLPNKNPLFTCYFMRSMVPPFTSYGFSAAPPKSRKKSSPAASACSLTRPSTKSVLPDSDTLQRHHRAA